MAAAADSYVCYRYGEERRAKLHHGNFALLSSPLTVFLALLLLFLVPMAATDVHHKTKDNPLAILFDNSISGYGLFPELLEDDMLRKDLATDADIPPHCQVAWKMDTIELFEEAANENLKLRLSVYNLENTPHFHHESVQGKFIAYQIQDVFYSPKFVKAALKALKSREDKKVPYPLFTWKLIKEESKTIKKKNKKKEAKKAREADNFKISFVPNEKIFPPESFMACFGKIQQKWNYTRPKDIEDLKTFMVPPPEVPPKRLT